jgi:predicted dehydrogenase
MVRVAVIGLGYWGPNLVRNFFSVAGPDLRLCCDRDTSRLESMARSYPTVRMVTDAAEVFQNPEIDAVAIATPVSTHYPLVKAALNAGKSVLVEKPLANSVAHAEELVALAKQKGLVLMVDHVFVYSPAVQKIKEMLDSGHLGHLMFVDSVRINLGLVQRDVNVVWDLAPHDLSIIDHLVGRQPRSLAAFGAAHVSHDQEDVAYLNLDFGRGLIANFHVNWLSPVKIRYIMLGGSKRSIVYNDLHPAEAVKVYDCGIEVREGNMEDRMRSMIDYRTGDVVAPHLPPGEPLRNVALHFLECVEKQKTPITDGEAGLRVVRILDAAQRSIKAQGGRITL